MTYPSVVYHEQIAPEQEEAHAGTVRKIKQAALRLAQGGNVITTDDIHAVVDIPKNIDPRVMGVAFRPLSMWSKVGYVASQRPECHGRPIAQWKLKE